MGLKQGAQACQHSSRVRHQLTHFAIAMAFPNATRPRRQSTRASKACVRTAFAVLRVSAAPGRRGQLPRWPELHVAGPFFRLCALFRRRQLPKQPLREVHDATVRLVAVRPAPARRPATKGPAEREPEESEHDEVKRPVDPLAFSLVKESVDARAPPISSGEAVSLYAHLATPERALSTNGTHGSERSSAGNNQEHRHSRLRKSTTLGVNLVGLLMRCEAPLLRSSKDLG